MKKTDYKFWFITRDDNGVIQKATVRFYEGDTVREDEVSRYVRTKQLKVEDLKHLSKNGKLRTMKESTGDDCVYYDKEDFGDISTDDELRTFINSEIRKDKTREVINEQ